MASITQELNRQLRTLFLFGMSISTILSCDSKVAKFSAERYFDSTALALAKAIEQNQLDEVNQLAQQVDLNKLYREDMTPLMWAMVVNQQDAFSLLLKVGADPNLKAKNGTQPIGLAAVAKDNNAYLTLLLQGGGNPNSMYHTEPALHVAFDSEYYQNVDLLLASGADINIRDDHDNTILIKAGYQEKFAKAIDLINRGADINAQSAGGGIAFDVQESTPRAGSKAYLGQAQLKKLLVERGVKFPVLQPSKQRYAALQERWYQTPEGQQWQQKLQQVASDPLGFGDVWRKADDAAFAAFKAWMAATNIPEPVQPQPKFIDLND